MEQLLQDLSSGLDSSKYPPLLLLDFDSTFTTTSTLDPLLGLPTEIYKTRPPAASRNIQPPASAAQLSAAYKSDIKDYESSHLFRANHRKTRIMEGVHQKNLRPIEAASLERGKQAFAAAGVTRADIHSAASKALSSGEVVFRKGWKRLLARAMAKDGRIAVISANWSKFWIESLIDLAARREGFVDAAGIVVLDGKRSARKFEIDVWANEVLDENIQQGMGEASLRGEDEDEDADSESSSLSWDHNIFIPADKITAWQAIEKNLAKTMAPAASFNANIPSSFRAIFIGDSITDFDMLLGVDEGVIMRGEEKLKGEQLALKQLCARLGFPDTPIRNFGSNATDARLWWAKDFDEVVDSGIFGD